MLNCESCGFSGSLADFDYVGLAEEIGTKTMRRCRACGQLVIVEELEEQEKAIDGTKPWGLSDLWGRAFSKRDKEGEDDQM